MSDKIIITINRLNFVVKIPNVRYKRVMEYMLTRLSTYSFKYDYKSKRNIRVKDRVYASVDDIRLTYRFNINILKDCILTLANHGYGKDDIVIEKTELFKPAKMSSKIKGDKKPKDYQKTGIEALVKSDNPYLLMDLYTGFGKAESVDNLVKIPNGWKRMGDLGVGDLVITQQGLPTEITGVYPQGVIDLCKITFEDDRWIEVSYDHLWKVYNDNWENPKILNSRQLMLEVPVYLSKNDNLYIDLAIPEIVDDIDLEIDPYTYGLTLDNTLTDNDIDISYINSSVKQRLEFLKGLLKDSNVFITYSEKLATSLTTLVRSVGGICKVVKNNKNYFECYIDLDSNRLAIKSVKINKGGEAKCISIADKDSLYVTKDYIVTHNTYMSMEAITKIGKRTLVLVLPKYIDKWINDINDLTTANEENIMVVKGSSGLNDLIALANNNDLTSDFILIGVRTVLNYIKEYENRIYDHDFNYGCRPEDLMEVLGVGVILNDETHQEFHAVFKSCLYFNTEKFIGLSATLENHDKNLNKMYDMMFPGTSRISGLVKYDSYINSYMVRYRMEITKYIKYKRPQGYSHNLFEESIIRNNILLKEYVKMVIYYVTIGYIERREDGDKVVIFVASVKLASMLTKHLEMLYDYLDVRRYVEDDPYENIMDADICITTPLSAGTALDIPNLITTIQTVSIKSLQAVKQVFGRLRNLKGKEMRYYYLYCKDVPNQYSTYLSNKEILKPYSKEWNEIEYHNVIRTR